MLQQAGSFVQQTMHALQHIRRLPYVVHIPRPTTLLNRFPCLSCQLTDDVFGFRNFAELSFPRVVKVRCLPLWRAPGWCFQKPGRFSILCPVAKLDQPGRPVRCSRSLRVPPVVHGSMREAWPVRSLRRKVHALRVSHNLENIPNAPTKPHRTRALHRLPGGDAHVEWDVCPPDGRLYLQTRHPERGC